MHRFKNSFAAMADQAAHGDVSARMRLAGQLEDQMVHIARRVLRDGGRGSSLDRRILGEARRFGLAGALLSNEQREHLIRLVARSVSSSVIDRIPLALDDERGMEDTVCQFEIPVQRRT